MMNGSKRSMLRYLGRIPFRRSLSRIAEPIFCRGVFLKPTPTVSPRSALASVLLLIFGLPAFLPLYNSSASLPECCRRDGKHRCLMTMHGMRALAETTATSGPPVCPFRSHPFHLGGAQYVPLVCRTSINLPLLGIARYECFTVHLSFVRALPPTRGPPATAHDFRS